MRKFIVTTVLLCICGLVKSQNITYTPFFRDSPHQSQPQQQTQRLRATAYQVDNNGNYIKIPIQVTETTYIHPTGNTSQEIKVTSYYHNDGYGGRWENCIYGATVQQCRPIFGNEMEQSFMFKANLLRIGWIYFDL